MTAGSFVKLFGTLCALAFFLVGACEIRLISSMPVSVSGLLPYAFAQEPEHNAAKSTVELYAKIETDLKDEKATAAELFVDSSELLERDGLQAAIELSSLVTRLEATRHRSEPVLRAIAYWECRSVPDAQLFSQPFYEPDWVQGHVTGRRVLRVGAGYDLANPSDAAAIARDGDIVEIAAGTYENDVATWHADNMTIRSVGGLAVIRAPGMTSDNKGIWVVKGDNMVINGIRIEGARSTHKNGSGIRLNAHNLWVRNSEFYDNENHIMTWNRPGGELVVERSIFLDNGAGDEYGHNIYVGRISAFRFFSSYSEGARKGHHVKSRALDNEIMYNRISDEEAGTSSYLIDLPEGGRSLIVGNELRQGRMTENRTMISIGTKMRGDRDSRFFIASNTFFNEKAGANIVMNRSSTPVEMINNVFVGHAANVEGDVAPDVGNFSGAETDLEDPRRGDYRLASHSKLIDFGHELPQHQGTDLTPTHEYLHPASAIKRNVVWRIDPGAHEFCGWPGDDGFGRHNRLGIGKSVQQ